MADAIAQGINEADPNVAVKIFNVARSDKNDIITHVFRSKAALVGTSTMNNVMMPKIAGMLEEITGLRFLNKKPLSVVLVGMAAPLTVFKHV